MGFGDWISNTVGGAEHAVTQVVDDVGNTAEHLVHQGEQWAGSTIDHGAHAVGGALDAMGAHGAASWVDHAGDSLADHLGAQVPEMQLGQTTDPKDLIHGDVGAIQESAGHLHKLASGFEETASGLRGIDTGNWSGEAADAFHAAYPKAPAGFVAAGQACGEAATALSSYADTVTWAQQQAAQAIHLYQQGVHASEQARASYNQAVDSYNSAVDRYNAATGSGKPPTGLPPTKPAPFHDPGTAMIEQAQHLLTNARNQRDSAAASAQSQIAAATQGAPAEPSFHDRMLNDAADLYQLGNVESAHFLGGVIKGTGDLVRFARSNNVLDPYNVTHPAEYLDNMSKTAAGLLYAGNHPATLVKSLVGSGWSTDPAEAAGKLVPNLLLAVGTDGAGTGADAAVDVTERSALELAENPGRLADVARDDHSLVACGDPVDVATGAVFLNQVDLELPGVLPLVLNRRHVSSWRYGRWFGRSWACTLDERLDVGEDEVMLIRGDGVILTYPHPNVDEPVHPRGGARWPMLRTETGGYQVTDPETGQVRHYLNNRRGAVPLAAITDPTGHRIMIARDERGAPTEVRHTGGYRVLVDTDTGRVTAFTVVLDDGSDPVTVAAYEYEDGHLTGVVNASNQPLQFTYDDEGRLTQWTDRNGTSYFYVYDEAGRCVRQGGSDGFMTARFAYADLGGGLRETVMTDATGADWTYRINDLCQVVEEVDPLGGATRSSWDEQGRLIARTDPLRRTNRLVRDVTGTIVKVVRPDGSACEITPVDAGGRPQPGLVTDFDGSIWRYEYDEAGNRTAVTDPTGATTRYEYDEHGHLVAVTDPLGATQTFECDGAGLPLTVTDPARGVTRFSRDGFGRVVEVEDPTGTRTRMTWTPEGRLASRTTPDGATETYRYDGEGNLIEHTDAGGRVTSATYTHFDLLATQTAPDGSTTRYDYDKTLRLTQVTNPQGLTWRYDYDAAGRLIAETDFDDRTQHYTYDAAGQLTGRTNGAQQQIAHEHDLLGRVIRSRTDDQVTEFVHDPLGRLLRSTTPDVELVLQRDPAGRVVSEAINGRAVTSTYDVAGRRTRRTTPAGVESNWAYDDAGRLVGVSVAGHQITFDRDQAGREVHRSLTGQTSLDQVWDPSGRLTTQTLAAAPAHAQADGPGHSSLSARLGGVSVSTAPRGPEILQERHYRWEPGGRLSGIEDHLTGARSFKLDPIGRITGVIGNRWAESYTYDPTGNITAAAAPGVSADGSSQRREYSGTRLLRAGPTRYTYDRQGRLVAKTTKRISRKPETWRYAWDAEDRMVGVTTPDGTRWRYLYDGLGRRVAKQRLADKPDGAEKVIEEIWFAWDGTTLTEQTTTRAVDPESRPGATISWTHDGLSPISQVNTTAGAEPQPDDSIAVDESTQAEIDAEFFSIVTDLVGAPTELVNAEGELVWHARRTLWGAPTEPTATDPVPLRFPGQYADAETGLYYNLNRYYDPTTARYASPDPLGLAPSPNPTGYVDNPAVAIDPLGLAPCAPGDLNGPGTTAHGPMNPGPLSDEMASTFRGGRYETSVLQQDTVLYRAGTHGRPFGQFFSSEPPGGVIQTRIDKAIPEAWPDGTPAPLDTAYAIQIPKGTTIHVGDVANQGGIYMGGTKQTVIEKPWEIPGAKVVGSWPIR